MESCVTLANTALDHEDDTHSEIIYPALTQTFPQYQFDFEDDFSDLFESLEEYDSMEEASLNDIKSPESSCFAHFKSTISKYSVFQRLKTVVNSDITRKELIPLGNYLLMIVCPNQIFCHEEKRSKLQMMKKLECKGEQIIPLLSNPLIQLQLRMQIEQRRIDLKTNKKSNKKKK